MSLSFCRYEIWQVFIEGCEFTICGLSDGSNILSVNFCILLFCRMGYKLVWGLGMLLWIEWSKQYIVVFTLFLSSHMLLWVSATLTLLFFIELCTSCGLSDLASLYCEICFLQCYEGCLNLLLYGYCCYFQVLLIIVVMISWMDEVPLLSKLRHQGLMESPRPGCTTALVIARYVRWRIVCFISLNIVIVRYCLMAHYIHRLLWVWPNPYGMCRELVFWLGYYVYPVV